MIALFFLSLLAQAELSRVEICRASLNGPEARFKFGQVTHTGQTAHDFFASPVTADGQPRLVMMVGIPGSGKSTWAAFADSGEWKVLSIDETRAQVASPSADAEVLFSPNVLARTRQVFETKFLKALAQGESIVLDQNNLTPFRVRAAQQARAAGYHIEALVFSSASVDVNLSNVGFRPDHVVDGLSPEAVRARAKQFEFFNADLRLGRPGNSKPETIDPFLSLVDQYSSLRAAHQAAASPVKEVLEDDQFDQVEFVWTPSVKDLPHDSPVLRKRPRLYAAITNKCNRACTWCCVYSNPYKNTFLTPNQLAAHFPKDTRFDLQLEGGEPTIHPQLFEFVESFRAQPNAGTLILVTNAVKIPRNEGELKNWVAKFGEPFTLKVSINHYLLERDRKLMAKAARLKKIVEELGGQRELILNVRLRKGEPYQNDDWVRQEVQDAGLMNLTNIFYLQSYGLASDQGEWEPPFTVNDNYVLINPDGSAHRGSLIDRANEMGDLK